MSNKKPQWLIDAEKATQQFNESEAGKLTDGQIGRSTWASFNGIGKRHEEGKTREIHSKRIKTLKDQGYYQSEKWKAFCSNGGTLGGKALVESGKWKQNLDKAIEKSLDARAIARHEKYTAVLDKLETETFTATQIDQARLDCGYEKAINLRFMIKNDYIEKCHVGTNPRWDPTLYKKK